ncbi:MAG TPA: CorA family divalent cation transporter [Pseudonocardiaceae bacterium]|nr:CorA family divalent cation transporter [Pseudonocardiaceae bacterium]
MDREPARSGHHHPRDPADDSGQPAQRDHEKVDQLGRDHRLPTAVTGFYGQNVPYPGFQQEWGFLCSILLILVIGGTLYLVFKRKQWL